LSSLHPSAQATELVSQLRKLGPELIVLEASGRTSGISV
jgi:hypothetical protein